MYSINIQHAIERHNRALDKYISARMELEILLNSVDIDAETKLQLEESFIEAREKLYKHEFIESETSAYNNFIEKINTVLTYIRNIFSYVFHHIDDYSRIIGQITIAITATASMIAALHGL